jgi:hypothetical protein
MTDEEVERWHNAIDRSIWRAIRSEQAFTAESIIDDAGLILCSETVHYLRHMLHAICPGPISRDDTIPVEEKCECLLKVLFADADQLDDERAQRVLDGQRTLRLLRECYERMQLRTVLAEETRRFIDEDE